jgi:Fe-S cluster biogenesis protein NfuA
MASGDGIQHSAERVEELIAKLEASTDPAVRAGVRELVQGLMDIHGAALEKMMEIISRVDDPVMHAVADDPLVSSLLLLYGLHPDDLDTRVSRAVEKMRQYLRKHGGEIRDVSINESKVTVRLDASGCHSTSHALRTTVEDAIRVAAPDVVDVQIEDGSEQSNNSGFVPLGDLRTSSSSISAGSRLSPVEEVGSD